MSQDELLLAAVEAFSRGDARSFDLIYSTLWLPVYRRIACMGIDESDAQDIAQKALVRVYLHAAQAKFPDAARFWAWVYTIATREVYKHWKRRCPELVSEEALALLDGQPATTPDPAEAAEHAQPLAAVGQCMAALPEEERLFLLGVLTQGLTFRQAAALHGMTLGQFKHRYERAMDSVRRCLAGKGYET